MNRDQLIAAMQAVAAEKPRAVEVRGWGTVYVRSLTTAEVEEAQAEESVDAAKDGKDTPRNRNRLARGAARLLCDEAGTRLFDHNNPDDVALLAKQPWAMLQKILSAGDDEVKEAAEGN